MNQDEQFMRTALKLAARGRGRTAPNPMVGAVVVSAGRVVGQGWHRRAGEPHAEVLALRQAGEAAKGATLYVSLEPCCHHGRTPPCTDAILAAGVSRVVAAMQDPFPKVAGGGFAQLRGAGVEVATGVLDEEARELNRAFIRAVETGLPWVTLKMAMTLDGKIATRTGDSRWVTGETARRFVHGLRNQCDAVMVGIGTVRADDPLLTCRLHRGRNPLRVVVDARAELPLTSRLAQTARGTPTLLAVSQEAEITHLEAAAIEVERIPSVEGRVDIAALLRRLVERGIHSVLCEGGAVLAGSLLDARLVDDVVWFIAPKLVGGEGPGPVAGGGVERMAEAFRIEKPRIRRYGEDLAVLGCLNRARAKGTPRE